jgi:hypothetical protein
MMGVQVHKDFGTSHALYHYQGVHMFSYMQSITETLHAGWQFTQFPAPQTRSLLSYGFKWNINP